MSTTANQVTGGGKTQEGNKKSPKNIFPQKGRPVLNAVQKSLEQSSIFLPKIRPQSDKQQSNTAALKNGGFSDVLFRKIKAKILPWKLLQTSFCAAHSAITKCTPLKPTQSQEHQPGKNALKIKTKSPKDASKSG